VVAGQIVARRVPGGAPELFDACRAQRVGRDGVVRIPPEFEGDMVDPRFRSLQDVDDVVVPIAGEEGRNPRDVVGETEAQKILVGLSALLGHRYPTSRT
jgi:hypothetical protein